MSAEVGDVSNLRRADVLSSSKRLLTGGLEHFNNCPSVASVMAVLQPARGGR